MGKAPCASGETIREGYGCGGREEVDAEGWKPLTASRGADVGGKVSVSSISMSPGLLVLVPSRPAGDTSSGLVDICLSGVLSASGGRSDTVSGFFRPRPRRLLNALLFIFALLSSVSEL